MSTTAPTSAQQALDDLDVPSFWKRGFAILPRTYTTAEIEEFRAAAYATRADGGDLLANPRLRSVLTDGRMVAVARKLLDTDKILYGGDSSFTINGRGKGWHKDNTDRRDQKAPDWTQGRYTQLRFGIYLQDHSRHTGGLNLREGSHDVPNLKQGELRYLKVRPGDLAVWSMRITHSGNGMLLRRPFSGNLPLPGEQESIPEWKVAKRDGDRIALFVHLGADDAHGQRYLDYLKTRTYMVNRWRAMPWTDEARQAGVAAGLTLRDMPAEVLDDPGAGMNEQWEPFAY